MKKTSLVSNGNILEEDTKSDFEDNKETNWKQFFSTNEIETAIAESKKPVQTKKKVTEPVEIESDSEPSCDNYDEEELEQVFNIIQDSDEEFDQSPQPKIKVQKNKPLIRHDTQA